MTYKYGDETQITPHFKAREFQCKCNEKHDFQISDELVKKLEELYAKLDCSQIVVSSGFRCAQHDKNVGGSGTGQHTLGNAADICCYGKDGQPISSKIVCCKAQDIGFRGIARINDTYTHVDVRNGKWYGDETKGNSYCIPCHDFYKYYGIQKEGEKNVSAKNGIDISWCQQKIDWNKVKTDFAIIQAGGGYKKYEKDVMFESHYAGAESAGIPVGAYWFSRAVTVDEAVKEADIFISILNGKKFAYPVYMDVEIDAQLKLGKQKLSEIVKAFLDRVEKAGYWVGLYMSRAHVQSYIDDSIKNRYALWLAEWGSKLNYSGSVGMWQKSETGNVTGITGNVDLDECYVDYPAKIKERGLNGFGKQSDNQPATSDTMEVEIQFNGAKYAGTIKKV